VPAGTHSGARPAVAGLTHEINAVEAAPGQTDGAPALTADAGGVTVNAAALVVVATLLADARVGAAEAMVVDVASLVAEALVAASGAVERGWAVAVDGTLTAFPVVAETGGSAGALTGCAVRLLVRRTGSTDAFLRLARSGVGAVVVDDAPDAASFRAHRRQASAPRLALAVAAIVAALLVGAIGNTDALAIPASLVSSAGSARSAAAIRAAGFGLGADAGAAAAFAADSAWTFDPVGSRGMDAPAAGIAEVSGAGVAVIRAAAAGRAIDDEAAAARADRLSAGILRLRALPVLRAKADARRAFQRAALARLCAGLAGW
jgi:hypothetical protein